MSPASPSAFGPEPDATAALDLQHLAEIRDMPGMKGGSLLTEFVALFLREEPARFAELTRLAAARDYGELQRLAHASAGSCAMLGALAMQHAALTVQGAAQANAADAVAAALVKLDQEWARLQAALREQRLI